LRSIELGFQPTKYRKAGLAPAFLFVGGTYVCPELLTAAAKSPSDAFSSREPVPASLENAMDQNNPLMARRQHWKSFPVLPTFQLSLIGVPDLPAVPPTSCVTRAWKYRYG